MLLSNAIWKCDVNNCKIIYTISFEKNSTFLKINWNFYYNFILIIIEKRILHHKKYNELQAIYKFDSNFNFENNENKNDFDIIFDFDNKKFKFSKIIKVV